MFTGYALSHGHDGASLAQSARLTTYPLPRPLHQVREHYREMMELECPDMHDTAFTFNSLQASSSYDAAA